MSKGQSIHAAVAIEALHECAYINPIIRGAMCDPRLGSQDHHPNAPFFEAAEWYLTCRQVTHAGDTFNTYCQNILAEILAANPAAWALAKRHFSSKSDPAKTIARLRIQRETDTNVREALRESLEAAWCGEVEIIVELRNRIVHQSGMDPERRVNEVIKRFPPREQFIPPSALDPQEFPVAVDHLGKLQIDARTANWATHHVMNHISQMDLHLCERFGLPRKRRPIPKISFAMRQDSTALSISPGQPLPTRPTKALSIETAVICLAAFPEYIAMANPEEIACARKWREIRAEIHEFVTSSCSELGIQICGFDGSLAGSIRSHTIEGHDHHLGYQLRSHQRTDESPKFLGIRLRQEKFDPFLTLWGTHTQMRDFHPCELSAEVRSYIEDCIGHAISR